MEHKTDTLPGFLTELESQPSLTDTEKMNYAQWASRLNAAEGNSEYLTRFFATYAPEEINRLFLNRCHHGLQDIQHVCGEDLAIEIFTVQDFWILTQHAPAGLFSPESQAFMDLWRRTAEASSLDDEAAQTLHAYLEQFPLPEDDLLDIVAAPQTEEELAFWIEAFEPLEDQILDASDALQERVKIERTIQNPESVNERYFRLIGVDSNEILRIRIHSVPAFRCNDSDIWRFDFRLLTDEYRSRLFSGADPLIIKTYRGATAELDARILFDNTGSAAPQPLRNADSYVTLIPKGAFVLAAAEEEKERVFQFYVEGVQAYLDITVSFAENAVLVNVFAPDDDENATNELDGWALLDSDGTALGVIEERFVRFDINLFNGKLKLQAPDGSVRILTEKKDVD